MKMLAIEMVQSQKYGAILDFVISGRSLLKEIERREYDYVPRLGSEMIPTDVETREVLLLEKADDLPNGRAALYICPCGDYDCGIISASITREDKHIIWSDISYENEADDELIPLDRLGPYRFEEKQYRQAIMGEHNRD